jgi:hypothetical protein
MTENKDERTDNPTTASDLPRSPGLTKEILLSALERLKTGDLLQQKGVEKDWVCVINPALVHPLMQHVKELKPLPPLALLSAINPLDRVLGRQVFIINEAPLDVEYMPKLTMYAKYPGHFIRYIEILKELEDGDFEDGDTHG